MLHDPSSVASQWLASLARSLEARSVTKFIDLFTAAGWFRDVLVFDWNSRSLEGQQKIRNYVEDKLPSSSFSGFSLDERTHIQPSVFPAGPNLNGIEFAFTFETPMVFGRGYARIIPNNGEDCDGSEYKALSLFMCVDDIKGHEELDRELGVYGGHTKAWEEVRNARRQEIERDPQVIIVGAGLIGLNLAARFKQMGIRTLLIDKSERVGDVWRKRYPTLSLHTPRSHHAFLYAPYPTTWPLFTPKDKLASFMEQYVDSQDLVVWNSTTLASPPTYDPTTKRWTASINREGSTIVLHPAHIVVATGTAGKPHIPQFRDLHTFKGETAHCSAYQGGKVYAGKRVIVIGAGNTSADVCQDLVFCGAAEVTMIQRSHTCVGSSAWVNAGFQRVFPEGVPIEISDLKLAAMPLGLLKQILITQKDVWQNFEKEMHDSLRSKGFNVSLGPDEAGLTLLVDYRFGGFWVDVGCAALIANDSVKVKSGVEVDRFTETGILFQDGKFIEADVVLFATGYENMRKSVRNEFGHELIDRTSEVWGLDEEYELRGSYRPSGQPGLWYAGGSFPHVRFMSKQLALLIKAEELELTKYPNIASIPQQLPVLNDHGSTNGAVDGDKVASPLQLPQEGIRV